MLIKGQLIISLILPVLNGMTGFYLAFEIFREAILSLPPLLRSLIFPLFGRQVLTANQFLMIEI